jgi:hypothetical protein
MRCFSHPKTGIRGAGFKTSLFRLVATMIDSREGLGSFRAEVTVNERTAHHAGAPMYWLGLLSIDPPHLRSILLRNYDFAQRI